MVEGATLHGRLQAIQEGHVRRAGERGITWAGGEGKIMDRLRGRVSSDVCIKKDWRTAALDHGILYNTVCEVDIRFVAACVREEEKALENRQKRKAEEADNVKIIYRMTLGSLRRFRAALIGPTQRLPKLRQGSLKTLRIRCFR